MHLTCHFPFSILANTLADLSSQLSFMSLLNLAFVPSRVSPSPVWVIEPGDGTPDLSWDVLLESLEGAVDRYVVCRV